MLHSMTAAFRAKVFVLLGGLVLLSGCEELGKDARGEVPTTALQSIAEQRKCIPYQDISRIAAADDAVEFILRDGSRWRNTVETGCPLSGERITFAVADSADESCAGDELQLLAKPQGATIQRYMGSCRLGEFHKL